MQAPQLEALRTKLLEHRTSLRAQLAQLRGGNFNRAEASADHFAHAEDSPAQVATEMEREFALDDHESRELRLVQAALDRMKEGLYGQCVECGEAIAPARLEASPEAARCIRCQTAAEQATQRP